MNSTNTLIQKKFYFQIAGFFLFIIFLIPSCQKQKLPDDIPIGSLEESYKESILRNYHNIFQLKPEYISNGFDFPVGIPDGKGYYNAQGFLQNNHLGDDWNGVNGGDSDFGDSFHAASNGYVIFSGNLGRRSGWGKVVRVIHKIENHPLEFVETLYAHCDKVMVNEGDYLKKGDQIGTIGNADGLYKAHLHFEIRHDIYMGIGAGYGGDFQGYLNPSEFIKANRVR